MSLQAPKKVDTKLNRHTDTAQLGLQEKFLNSVLLEREMLNAVDMQRFLELTGTAQNIHVSSDQVESLQAVFAYEHQQHNDYKPYSVNLVLKHSHEPSWFSVQVKVDPGTHQISYTINDNANVTEAEHKAIVDSIQTAMAAVYKPDDQWRISEPTLNNLEVSDGQANGLREVQALFKNDPSLHQNQLARDFANSSIDSESLYKLFFEVQLKGINLTTDEYQNLGEAQRACFQKDVDEKYHLTEDALREAVELSTVEAYQHETVERNPEVQKLIEKFKPGSSILIFPPNTKTPVSAADTHYFFYSIHKKLADSNTQLGTLEILQANPNILTGLNAYLSEPGGDQRFTKIKINFNPKENNKRTVSKFKAVLANMPKKGIEEIEITNRTHLSNDDLKEIAKFLKDREIPVHIKLTGFAHPSIQRDFDTLYSDNRRAHRIANLGTEKVVAQQRKLKTEPRTRAKISKNQSKSTDVELEQEQEQEREVQVDMAIDGGAPDDRARGKADSDLPIGLTFTELCWQVSFKAYETVPVGNYLLSIENLHQFWCETMGAVFKSPQWMTEAGQHEEMFKYAPSESITIKGKPLGSLVNSDMPHMSNEALEQMLRYQHLFQMGFSPEYLPKGFVLLELERGQYLLHYDENAALYASRNPLIQELTDKPSLNPLANAVMGELMRSLEGKAEFAQVVHAWQELQTEPYRPDESNLYRKSVIQLVSMSAEQRAAALKICSTGGKVNYQALDFLLTSSDRISHMFANGFDKEIGPGANLFIEQFGTEANAKLAVEFASQYAVNHKQPLTQDNALLQFIQEKCPALERYTKPPEGISDKEGAGIQQVSTFLSNMSVQNVEALMDVYNQYGDKGLSKMLASWETIPADNFEFLSENVFAKSTSLLQFVEDSGIESIKNMQGFRGDKAVWFQTLLQKHIGATGSIDMPAAIAAFSEFSRVIKDRQLEFYSPVGFDDVTNFYVAQTRMLEILDRCDAKDVPEQWNCITQLSLQANGAVRAMKQEAQRSYEATVITPEMQIHADNYSPQSGYANTHRPKDLLDKSKFPTDADLKKAYFSLIAAQKNRCSLRFYQTVYDKIQKENGFSDHTKRALLGLVVGATTGELNIKALDKLALQEGKSMDEVATSYVKKLTRQVHGLTSVPLIKNMAQESLTEFLVNLHLTPPIPILDRLMYIAGDVFRGTLNPATIEKRGAIFEEYGEVLNILAQQYGNIVYQGLSLYTDADFEHMKAQGKNLLFEHIEILKDNKLTGYDDFSQGKRKGLHKKETNRLLITLISTFNLTTSEIAEINKIKDENFDAFKIIREGFSKSTGFSDVAFNYVLEMMKDIDQKDANGHTLTPSDLIDILRDLPNSIQFTEDDKTGKVPFNAEHKAQIRNIIQSKIGGHFPDGYFNRFKLKGIPEDTKKIIKEKLPSHEQTITRILTALSADGTPDQFNDVVQKLYHLTHQMSESEKRLFFKTIDPDNLSDLYREPADIKQFDELLDGMIKSGGADSLYFFLKQRELEAPAPNAENEIRQAKPVDDLMYKANYFISKVLPELNKVRKEQEEPPIMKKDEAYTLLIQQILAANKTRLATEVDIHFLRDNSAISIISILEGKVKDIDVAESTSVFSELLDGLDARITVAESSQEHENCKKLLGNLRDLHKQLSEIFDHGQGIAALKDQNIATDLIIDIHAALAGIETDKYLSQTHRDSLSEQLHEIVNIYDRIIEPVTTKDIESLQQICQLLAELDPNLNDVMLDFNEEVTHLLENQDPEKFTPQLLNDAIRNIRIYQDQQKSYANALIKFSQEIDNFIKVYPGAKPLLIQLQAQMMNGDKLEDVYKQFQQIKDVFVALKDENMVRSLCVHFDGDNEDSLYDFDDLVQLLNNVDQLPEPKSQKAILNIVTLLLNNDKWLPEVTIDVEKHMTDANYRDEYRNLRLQTAQTNLDILIAIYQSDKSIEFTQQVTAIYQQAPFPSLDQLLQWHDTACQTTDYQQSLKNQYAEFEKRPCPREITDDPNSNGFHLDKAKAQVAQMKGAVTYSDDELINFQKEIDAARDKDVPTLLNELQQVGGSPPVDYDKLVALSAELLYRSKGAKGNSYEINTTQYLAIHSLLKGGPQITSGIGTGEGKTRIMMISIAAQLAMGKTVDFVTSDVQLATRDYLNFQSYFNLLGAETNLIRADSNPSEYKISQPGKPAVNFSDASNLNLFRNKAISLGMRDQVIDPNATNRSLMLDEADKTYFDVASTRFNFSGPGDKSIKDMEWVYPLLMEYFSQTDPIIMDQFYNDVDACNESFLAFLETKNISEKDIARYKLVSQKQQETWHRSAIIAQQLEFDVDYAIAPDATIRTPYGPKIASSAQLLAGGRVQKGSKFSFGVHQCLHARLNIIKNSSEQEFAKILEATPPEARAALVKLKNTLDTKCQYDFNIDEEKQIIYSSSSKTMLDSYREGSLLAVTGTPGSILEQEEARLLIGTSDDKPTMKFTEMPRHEGLFREDKPIMMAKDERKQVKRLVEQILESRRNGQPIVLFCETDDESKALFETLQDELKKRGEDPKQMQRISGSDSPDNENKKLVEAGKSGMLTISTEMIGRGTDIKLQDAKAKASGLSVLLTYLPRERDLVQMVGRSGRKGAPGTARLILNKQRLRKRLGKAKLGKEFYLDRETYIRRAQALMDKREQVSRVLTTLHSDFRAELNKNFYEELKPAVEPSQHDELVDQWKNFMSEADMLWNEEWAKILEELDPDTPAHDMIDKHMQAYQEKIQELWTTMRRELEGQHLKGKDVENPHEKLREKVPDFVLPERIKSILKHYDVEKEVQAKRTVADKYDPAHDGQTVLYTKRFVKLKATLSGERKIFADIRANRQNVGRAFPNILGFIKGDLSFGELFSGKADTRRADVITTTAAATSDDTADTKAKKRPVIRRAKSEQKLGFVSDLETQKGRLQRAMSEPVIRMSDNDDNAADLDESATKKASNSQGSGFNP